MSERREGGANIGEDDTFEALLKQAAHASGPAPTGLGMRLRAGDLLRDGRLRIERRLGEGGMGIVYEAFDAQRAAHVALKTLSRLDPESVYRLKSEFRSLAEVSHPNLCRLYELFAVDTDWFFTMELVRGQRFDEWVRPAGVLDLVRLRAALTELFEGVDAIHAAGKLHRDLKPSNVLVADDGRVVVLDFGLASDPEPGGIGQTVPDAFVSGTPAYMAPEQAAGAPATIGSDFYALGVMLFEALTGRLPFQGRPAQLLLRKQSESAPRASALVDNLPSDLEELCDVLLSREQELRPSATQLRALLAPSSRRSPIVPRRVPSVRPSDEAHLATAPLLLGREDELATLERAYASTQAGTPVVMLVSGASGMGKSALVSAFLDDLARTQGGHALVLSGRCYEREHVPFKGFDALVDDLSRYLRRLPREEALALLPREVFALARVFPVLERVAVVAEAPVKELDDPQELRRRAFVAFGELLGRIRDRRPLCVFIDDLQWMDADAVLFMRALLVDRDPAPILLLLSHRSDAPSEEHTSAVAEVSEVAEANRTLRVERLRVTPLAEPAAQALALANLPAQLSSREPLSLRIAREAGGSPFFVAELARHAARVGGQVAELSLSRVLLDQLAELSASARGLLELSALAGQPLRVATLLTAADANHDALDELRARRLVQLGSVAGDKTLECYHDRVRESVAGQLPAAKRTVLYGALAEVLLLAAQAADHELLATCFEGAGRPARAAHFAALAAARAEQGMAFDRAAELYRKSLALGADDDPARQARRVALADALSNAGRGREAAEAYLDAAARVHGIPSTQLRRHAVDELLGSGYAAEGERLVRELCREVGVAVPKTHAAALLTYGLLQARLRLGGLAATRKAPQQASERDQLRLDVLRAASRLAAGDPVLGLWAASQHLVHALAAREPSHLAHALATEAYNVLLLTPGDEPRIARLFALAEQQAIGAARPEVAGYVAVLQGMGCVYGRAMAVETGRRKLSEGLELLRGCRGVRYEIDIAQLYLTRTTGTDLAGEARNGAMLVEQAFSLGRVWAGTNLTAMSALARLAVGDSASMKRHVEWAQQAWKPSATMQWTDVTLMLSVVQLARYRGEPERSCEAVDAVWPWYERSPVRQGAVGRATMHVIRGAATLAAARKVGVATQRGRSWLDTARKDLKTLEKISQHPYAHLALALRTGLALASGDHASALRELRTYVNNPPPTSTVVRLDVLCARRLLGQLLPGDEGRTTRATAEAELRALGVAELDATCELVLTGCSPD